MFPSVHNNSEVCFGGPEFLWTWSLLCCFLCLHWIYFKFQALQHMPVSMSHFQWWLGVGSTIGAGIYVLVGTVAREHTGPGLTVSFLIAGVAAALSALCYAELSCCFPSAGSAYHYSYICIGERYMYKCTLASGLCCFPLLLSLYMFALPTWCMSIHRKVELWFLAYLCFVLRLQLRKIMVSVAWLIGWALILEYTIGGSSVARGISPNLVMLSIKSSL